MKWLSFFRSPQRFSSRKKIPYSTEGKCYDLLTIYKTLNTVYFNDELELSITWFASPHRKVKSHRILGLYDFKSRLIKIHRLLDHPSFPHYFISYIVYHEMLHSILPPLKKRKGRHRIHHTAFKQRERSFIDYERARAFEKENLPLFFI